MSLSGSDFIHCGFPEEYMFWGVFVFALVSVSTLALMHAFIKEDHKDFGIIPVVSILFRKEAFDEFGKLLRKVFILSTCLLVFIMATFVLGYKLEILDCGKIISSKEEKSREN